MTKPITSPLRAFTPAGDIVAGHELAGDDAVVTGGGERHRRRDGAGLGAGGSGRHPGGATPDPRGDVAFGWMDEAGKVARGFKTPEQGGSASVRAAAGAGREGASGLYLENRARARPWSKDAPFAGLTPHALDPEAAARLWAVSASTPGVAA